MKKIFSLLFSVLSLCVFAQERTVTFNFNDPSSLCPSLPVLTETSSAYGVCDTLFTAYTVSLLPSTIHPPMNSVQIITLATTQNKLVVYKEGRLTISSGADKLKKIEFFGRNSLGLLDGPDRAFELNVWTDDYYSEPQSTVIFRGSAEYSYLDSIQVTYEVTADVVNPIASSIENSSTIASFKNDTLTFDRDIVLAKDVKFNLKDSLGTAYPLNAVVDGNKLILSVKDSIATPGAYTLSIPEVSVYEADDSLYYNKEYKVNFNIAEPSNTFLVESTVPETETVLDYIPNEIILKFQGSVGGIVTVEDDIAIYNEADLTKPVAYFTAATSAIDEVTLTTNYPIKAAGVYKLVIPEGMFYDVNYVKNAFDHGVADKGATYNPQTVLRFFVKADPTNCTDSIKNADLSTTEAWNTENTKGIENGACKVGSGKSFDFSQTINLKAGQYKLTAQAAYRYSDSEEKEYAAIAAGEDTHYAKLYAQTATYDYDTNVMNRWEGATDAALEGTSAVEVNGKYVPNSSADVVTYMKAGQYDNVLIFNVQEDGQVKIGISKTESPEAGDYANIGAWTLYRIGDAESDPGHTASDETIELADSLLALQGVGYPKEDAAAREAIETLKENVKATDAQYEKAFAEFYNSTEIELPADTTYIIANVAKDGSKLYLSEVDGAIALTEDKSEACIFNAKTVDGKTLFMTDDSLYLHTLVNVNTYEGTSTANLTKDSTSVCNITVGKLSVDGIDAKDVFGYVSLFGEIGVKNGATKTAYSLICTKLKEIDMDFDNLVYFNDDHSSAFVIEQKDHPYVPFYTEICTTPVDNGDVETLNFITVSFPDVESVTYTAEPAVYLMYGKEKIAPISVVPATDKANQLIVNFRDLEKGTYKFYMPKGAFMCGNDTVQADTITFTINTGFGFQVDMNAMLVVSASTTHDNICGIDDVYHLSLYNINWKSLPYVTKDATVGIRRSKSLSAEGNPIIATGTLKAGVAYGDWREITVVTDSGTYEDIAYRDTVEVLDIDFADSLLSEKLIDGDSYHIVIDEGIFGDDNYEKYMAGDTSIRKDKCHVNKAMNLLFYYEPEITGVDTIAADPKREANPVIYDLTGRRVKEITKSGIYIVNGKKKYFK